MLSSLCTEYEHELEIKSTMIRNKNVLIVKTLLCIRGFDVNQEW